MEAAEVLYQCAALNFLMEFLTFLQSTSESY
jgi:hypothetical protein